MAQRNVKLDAKTKEKLIEALIAAHPRALETEGGVGRRTPLHIIFTGRNHFRVVPKGQNCSSHFNRISLEDMLYRSVHLRLRLSQAHKNDD